MKTKTEHFVLHHTYLEKHYVVSKHTSDTKGPELVATMDFESIFYHTF